MIAVVSTEFSVEMANNRIRITNGFVDEGIELPIDQLEALVSALQQLQTANVFLQPLVRCTYRFASQNDDARVLPPPARRDVG
jgi:hypothetical protein